MATTAKGIESTDEGEGAERSAASLSQAQELVHQRSRLSILAVLYDMGTADFVRLRCLTKLRDGNLSRHLSALEEGELVQVHKGFAGRRPRTEVALTDKGRRAFEDEVQILRSVIAVAERTHRQAQSSTAKRRTRQGSSAADAGA